MVVNPSVAEETDRKPMALIAKHPTDPTTNVMNLCCAVEARIIYSVAFAGAIVAKEMIFCLEILTILNGFRFRHPPKWTSFHLCVSSILL